MDYFEKIMELLMDNKKSIPLHVRKDVLNRVFDWLEHGEVYDSYIERQLNYLYEIIEMGCKLNYKKSDLNIE